MARGPNEGGQHDTIVHRGYDFIGDSLYSRGRGCVPIITAFNHIFVPTGTITLHHRDRLGIYASFSISITTELMQRQQKLEERQQEWEESRKTILEEQ